jgi:peptidoglycan hydrolase-like protein with peptidoglycan-binding domain
VIRIVFALLAGLMAFALNTAPAKAQDSHWVQLEAHATLRTAEEFAARYAQSFDNIAGFRIGGGWYALAMGPYPTPEAAQEALNESRARGLIRADAYVNPGNVYGARFWPVGAGEPADAPENAVAETAPPAAPEPVAEPVAEAPAAQPEPAAQPGAEPLAELPEESPAEARRREGTLSQAERFEIQTALQWFGYYALRIDGAFGPGTRRSIATWQQDMGFEATGFLTSRQQAHLVESWRAAEAALGLQPYSDTTAGIDMTLPLGLVQFDRYESPFVHFSGDHGLRVLLISQEGTQATLAGLYEIMQTLTVIPVEGERRRQNNGFLLTGQDDLRRAHVEARFQGGQIKGWALLWDPVADDLAPRILAAMRDSFTPTAGVLPASAGAGASSVARRDLLAGLEVRRPVRSRSGFYTDAVGTVVTTAEAVDQCSRITIDEAYVARLRHLDAATGIAVITPVTPLVPMAFAQFAQDMPLPGAQVRLSGYSYQDTLARPILSFGQFGAAQGLDGETHLNRLTLRATEGDTGGPVFDARGAVVGMLLPRPVDGSRVLPDEVGFMSPATLLQDALAQAGQRGTTSRADTDMAAEMLTRVSGDVTVLVSCWN